MALVQQSSKVWYWAIEIPAGITLKFLEGLHTTHVTSGGGVPWKHRRVSWGFDTLKSKLICQLVSTEVKAFLVESLESCFIVAVVLAKYHSKSFLLDAFNFHGLFLR